MSEKWTRDTGLVFTLFFLVLGIWKGNQLFLWVAAIFLVVVLFMPSILKPLSWAWLKVAEILGFVMNRVFFGIVFFVVILPVGMVRRVLYGDSRDLGLQPQRESAFIDRGDVVVANDLARPF